MNNLKNIYSKIAFVKAGVKIYNDKENSFAKYKYASLGNIFEILNQLLLENQLLVDFDSIEYAENDNVKYTVKVIDLENTEQSITKSFILPCQIEQKGLTKIQLAGATLTYSQRYIYAIIFSIAFDDEKDPNTTDTTKVTTSTTNNQYPDNSEKPWLSESQLSGMLEYIEQGQKDTVKTKMKEYKIKKDYYKLLTDALNS